MVFPLISQYESCISTLDLLISSKLIKNKFNVRKKNNEKLLFCYFVFNSKKRTFQTRKNNVYFTSKVLVVLEVFYF